MNLKRFEFRRVSNNFGEQSIVLEVVRYSGEWSIFQFNKKDNNYITNELITTLELYDFLINNQLIKVVRVEKSPCSALKFIRCVLQLTPKALIKTL